MMQRRSGSRALLLVALGPAMAIFFGVGAYWTRVHNAATEKPLSVAVLPFTGTGQDASFTDGVTEEITTRLGRIYGSGLHVIAPSSVMRNTVVKELSADYALQGTVRREGSLVVHITAQLIRSSDETQIWTKNYDGEFSPALSMQIAQEVRAAIKSAKQ